MNAVENLSYFSVDSIDIFHSAVVELSFLCLSSMLFGLVGSGVFSLKAYGSLFLFLQFESMS